MRYRVHWRHRITGARGCGELLERSIAVAWTERMNAEYPDIEHWIAPTEGTIPMDDPPRPAADGGA